MCLVAFSIDQHPRFPWVLASNRDEFFDRAADALAWWRPQGGAEAVLSGRDRSAGGTWLALSAAGRLALLTNFREPGRQRADAPSRGGLVLQALERDPADAAWLDVAMRAPYNGCNLLLADLRHDAAAWACNRPPQRRALGAGVYGLSNAALDTPWPKVRLLKQRLGEAVAAASTLDALFDASLTALADTQPAARDELPSTGLSPERESQLSPAFIRIAAERGAGAGDAPVVYGTRCSTVVVVEALAAAPKRRVHVVERRFDAGGGMSGETRLAFDLA